MGDIPHYFDIILFAMVAAFLVLRLRSVLGRRTGNERRRDALLRRGAGRAIKSWRSAPGPTPRFPLRSPARRRAASPTDWRRSPRSIPASTAEHFIAGARAAFEMIVAAFARGDKTQLPPLLSDEVFKQFTAAIDERTAAGETLETRIDKLKDIDIVEAGVHDGEARVTLKLVSDQINVLRAHDGSVVDGDPQNLIEKTDCWTFARETRSADPNWLLVATGSG